MHRRHETLPGDILDPLVMRLSFGGDKSFICDTMRMYVRDAPGMAHEVLAAVREEDNGQLASRAHALKGMTGYFTRADLYKSCLELEMLGRSQGLPLQSVHALGLWAGLNVRLADTLKAMERYIALHGQ